MRISLEVTHFVKSSQALRGDSRITESRVEINRNILCTEELFCFDQIRSISNLEGRRPLRFHLTKPSGWLNHLNI